MIISSSLVGTDKFITQVSSLTPKIQEAVRRTVLLLAIRLTAKVKEEKLSGQVLRNITGTLRRSINYKLWVTGDQVMARVGTNVEYAAVHEYGLLVPNRGKKGGSTKFPERSFLRSALAEMEPEIRKELEDSIRRAVKI
jgi:phage gpG-like protein